MSKKPDSSGLVASLLRGLATVVLAAGVALVVLVGYYLLTFDQRGGMDAELAGLAVGEPAPAVTAEGWVNGEPPPLDGKVVVVHGWFYNCPYCWKEAPEVAALHKQYGDRVAFVGLSPDPGTDLALVEEFVSEGGMTYPVGYGARESLVGFEARAFPALWVVGADGKVIWNRSLEGKQSLEEAIEAALAEKKA